MCKSTPSPPAPIIVNPSTSAAGQATFNREAALKQRALNMVDQYSPQGSVRYSAQEDEGGEPIEIEGIPQFKVTQELSPEQQGLYDTSTRLAQQYGDIGERQLGAVEEKLSTPFSLEGFGDAPQINETVRAETLANIMARQQPQLDRDRAALETSLANQGFVTGTEAYDDAFDVFNRGQTDFRLAADITAGNEMSRLFGLETNVRDRGINEALLERDRPMSELAAFMSGSQPSSPQFLPTPQGQVSAPDYLGASFLSADQQNRAAQNTFNQQTSTYNANLQGLYGLGAAGLGGAASSYGGRTGWTWSDRRLKRGIRKVGELANGLGVYLFRYVWGGPEQVGLMADEIRRVHPHAVVSIGGFDAVNYTEVDYA